MIYIATDAGVTSYYNGDFMPVKKLEDMNVGVVKLRKNRVIAATDFDGILYKSGNLVKTIVEPSVENEVNLTSLSQ